MAPLPSSLTRCMTGRRALLFLCACLLTFSLTHSLTGRRALLFLCAKIGIEARQGYEAALQSASDGTLAEASSLPLCHTCRIVKPLRSKHCQVAKRCVPMFDHYCPYINNTIGGGNYMAFIQFIFVGMLCQIATLAAAIQYIVKVNSLSPLAWAVACFFTMSTLMAVLMNQYHCSLILQQLTTNEVASPPLLLPLTAHHHPPPLTATCL